jgi:site-specific DNA-methyltransferase (adenine-specific)
MTRDFRNTILVGDAAHVLGDLAPASVDCVVTSPPYYQLRDYGVSGQLGLEPTIHARLCQSAVMPVSWAM